MSADKIKTNTLIVGAGQAGIAMSEHLSNLSIPHLVLERDRIAERWRTQRWDSLVANGPAWHDRFPGLEFDNLDPNAFATKDQIADYFEAYVKKFKVPVHTGVEVKNVQRNVGRSGFTIETSEGMIEASNVVAATGPFQRPIIPSIAPKDKNIMQIHSVHYRNPDQLPKGAVLVVGAGSSGVQIADELQCSGKQVYLSVGPHDRPPRAYRNRDYCWWLGVLGGWDVVAMKPGTEHVTIAVSGANGGKTIDFRKLALQGIKLVGLTKSFNNAVVSFESDLLDNIERGDKYYLDLLDAADDYIARNGLDLPPDPQARIVPSSSECLANPIRQLDLTTTGVSSIIWATGFGVDYSWMDLNHVFDDNGRPLHTRGISTEPGIYFIGLPWLSRRGSSFIWGVWHDAKYIADHISTQQNYLDYPNPLGD